MRKFITTLLLCVVLTMHISSSLAVALAKAANCTDHPFVFGMLVDPSTNWTRGYLGSLAAVHAFNKAGGLYGCNFTLMTASVVSSATTNYTDAAATLAATTNFLGFAEVSSSATDSVVAFAKPTSTPTFGVTSYGDALFKSASNYVLHHQTTFLSEMVANVNYGLLSATECNQYAFLYQAHDGLAGVIATLTQKMSQLGLPSPLQFATSSSLDASAAALNITTSLNSLPKGSAVPDCYVVALPDAAATSVIVAITQNATLYHPDRTFFFGSSFSDAFQADHATELKNYRSTRVAPHPRQEGYTVAQSFRAAVTQYRADETVPFSYSEEEIYSKPDAMSNYVKTRMMLEMASRVAPDYLTPATFFSAVYTSRLFTIDDLTMGPFNNGCSGGMTTSTGPCFCNSGLRRMFVSGVNVTGRSTMPIQNNAERREVSVAEFDVPSAQCAISTGSVKGTTHALMITDESIAPPTGSTLIAFNATGRGAAAAQQRIVATMEPALFAARAAALAIGTAASPVTISSRGSSSIVAELGMLHSRYRVGVTVASSISQVNVTAASAAANGTANQVESLKLAPMKYVWDEESVDTAALAFSDWDSGFIPFWPDMSTFIHASAGYASSLGRLGSSVVVCDTTVLASLVEMSWNTFESVAPSTTVIPASAKTSRAAAVAWLKSTIYDGNNSANAASTSAVTSSTLAAAPSFVVIVSQVATVLEAVIEIAAEVDVLVGDKSTQLFAIASSEFVLEDALAAINASSLPTKDASTSKPRTPSNVVFSSALSAYGTNGIATASYGTALAALSAAFISKGTTYAVRLSAMYKDRELAAGGLTVGPLVNQDCSSTQEADDLCQYNSGMNVFYIRNLTSATIGAAVAAASGNQNDGVSAVTGRDATDAALFRLTLNGRPSFRGLAAPVAAATSNTVTYIVAGCSAGVVLAIVIAVSVYFLFIRKAPRDNSNAPKDASRPFAMVFTDIQSSTMLWAHAPHHMGVALDAHHATLRLLVKEHKGYEVKTIGDSFMVAFESAQRALDFAVGVQRRLYNHDWETDVFDQTYREVALDKFPEYSPTDEEYDRAWCGLRVRVGVHFGEGSIMFDETSKGYDYYGTVVNTAARVEGVGHGGQVLLTAAAASAVTKDFAEPLESECDGGASVVDLGPQPLRGLDEPVHLYQVVPREFAGRRFPALRLDVENEVQDEVEEDEADPTCMKDTQCQSGASHHSPKDGKDGSSGESAFDLQSHCSMRSLFAAPTVENAAKIIAKMRYRNDPEAKAQVQGQLIFGHKLISTMFATSPASFKTATLKKIEDKWRVKQLTSGLKRCVSNGLHREDAMLLMIVEKCRGAADATAAPSQLPVDVTPVSRSNRASVAVSAQTPRDASVEISSPTTPLEITEATSIVSGHAEGMPTLPVPGVFPHE